VAPFSIQTVSEPPGNFPQVAHVQKEVLLGELGGNEIPYVAHMRGCFAKETHDWTQHSVVIVTEFRQNARERTLNIDWGGM
jgi:hypothetical protein